MLNHYSPKTFLRQTSNSILQQCDARQRSLADVEWSNLPEHNVEVVYDKWQDLPVADRIGIERLFESPEELSNEQGIQAIIEEGQFHRLDLAAELDQFEEFRDKVMWVELNHPRVFEVAGIINWAHTLPLRYWRRPGGMPLDHPNVAPEAISALARAIGAYYPQNQGRGTPNKYHLFADLAQRLGGDELDNITHIKSRLVALLRENGLNDLAACIKTQKSHYEIFLA